MLCFWYRIGGVFFLSTVFIIIIIITFLSLLLRGGFFSFSFRVIFPYLNFVLANSVIAQ